MYEKKLLSANEIFDKAMKSMAPLSSQESCARELASIFSFHLYKMELMDVGLAADELPSQHAIMVAPTGVGKTYLLRHMAAACGVNLIVMDGSSVTREGWKGPSFGQQLLAAKQAAKDVEAFARSVLFVDEADKMRRLNPEYADSSVMDNFLQLFNGGEVIVEAEGKQVDTIDVSRFTIIMGGAFAGLEDIIRARLTPKVSIGFGGGNDSDVVLDERKLLHYATPEDLHAYGIKKELIGRIGSILHIDPLEVEDYRRLLTAETGSVQANYRNFFFHGFGVGFEVSNEAVHRIAEECTKATTGARAVTPIVNGAMRDAVVKVDSDSTICKVVLNADENGCFACYEYGERELPSIGQVGNTDSKPAYMTGNSVTEVADLLCHEYSAAGCNEDYAEEFGLFIRMTLTYLQVACHPSERRFDNLQRLARDTDMATGATLSPYDHIITDYLNRPDHIPAMKRWYDAYCRARTCGVAQRLSKSLLLILRRLVQKYHTSNIHFDVQETAVTKDESTS